jgi:hypothetical protein
VIRIEKIISELKFDWKKKRSTSELARACGGYSCAPRSFSMFLQNAEAFASAVPVFCKQCLGATSPCSYLATEQSSGEWWDVRVTCSVADGQINRSIFHSFPFYVCPQTQRPDDGLRIFFNKIDARNYICQLDISTCQNTTTNWHIQLESVCSLIRYSHSLSMCPRPKLATPTDYISSSCRFLQFTCGKLAKITWEFLQSLAHRK